MGSNYVQQQIPAGMTERKAKKIRILRGFKASGG
jgi:hypothetical protein